MRDALCQEKAEWFVRAVKLGVKGSKQAPMAPAVEATSLMERMGWSWGELMATPYIEVRRISRVLSLRDREERKQREKQERKTKRQGGRTR